MDSTSSTHENKAASLLDGLAHVIVDDAALLESASSAIIAKTKASPQVSTPADVQQACQAMIRCALVTQETLTILQNKTPNMKG